MVLVGGDLYVACTDALLRFPYVAGATSIAGPGEKVVDLPAGTINHHWTKNVAANRDGSRLYVTVGSNSNVAENGMENEVNRAAILEVDPRRALASASIAQPERARLRPAHRRAGPSSTSATSSEATRPRLPDVGARRGLGWPYSYYGAHIDARVKPPRPDLMATAIAPDYALGSHVAPLGMAFYDEGLLGPKFTSGVFIGEHGSWNRRPRSGYKVVFVPFVDGRPPDCRKTCSPDLSMTTATLGDDP
jgi:glucose/arabinose dehydrogenase